MQRTPSIALCLALLVSVGFGGVAAANPPLDLTDPTSREIRIEFDTEVIDFAAIGGAFSLPAPASFDSDGTVATVVLDGALLEARITALFEGLITPIPGSFTDFVMTLEVATGEVLSLTSTGSIDTDVGLFDFQQSLQSDATLGFLLAPVLDVEFPFACTSGPDCTLVAGQPLDPATGQVVAVGEIVGILNPIFSPFGDLRLTEQAAISCDGAVAQATYAPDETQTYEFAMTNRDDEARFIEAKVWLEAPDGTILPSVNVGADGSVCLDAGATFASPPTSSIFVDETVPVGNWSIGCRLVDPDTGETLAEDVDRFEVLAEPR